MGILNPILNRFILSYKSVDLCLIAPFASEGQVYRREKCEEYSLVISDLTRDG